MQLISSHLKRIKRCHDFHVWVVLVAWVVWALAWHQHRTARMIPAMIGWSLARSQTDGLMLDALGDAFEMRPQPLFHATYESFASSEVVQTRKGRRFSAWQMGMIHDFPWWVIIDKSLWLVINPVSCRLSYAHEIVIHMNYGIDGHIRSTPCDLTMFFLDADRSHRNADQPVDESNFGELRQRKALGQLCVYLQVRFLDGLKW